VNRRNINADPLEMKAFEFKKDGAQGKKTSGKAAAMAKSRQVKKIIEAILDPKLSRPQQILAFHEAANHPRIRSTAKSAGLTSPVENYVAHYLLEQQKKMIGSAAETTKTKGRPTVDQRSFILSESASLCRISGCTRKTRSNQAGPDKGLWFTGSYRLPTFQENET
jgi:hypothetical protein